MAAEIQKAIYAAELRVDSARRDCAELCHRRELLGLARAYAAAGRSPTCASGPLGRLMAEVGLAEGPSDLAFDLKTVCRSASADLVALVRAYVDARIVPNLYALPAVANLFTCVCDTRGWEDTGKLYFSVVRADGGVDLFPVAPHKTRAAAALALQRARGGGPLALLEVDAGGWDLRRRVLPGPGPSGPVVARPPRPSWPRRLLARLFGPPPVTFVLGR